MNRNVRTRLHPEAGGDRAAGAELQQQVEAIVTRLGGTLEKTDVWGRRKLAYEIGRHKEGIYVLRSSRAAAISMKELDRRLKVTEGVIRHLVVRVDERAQVPNGPARKRQDDLAPPPRGARPAAGSSAWRGPAVAATTATTIGTASTEAEG